MGWFVQIIKDHAQQMFEKQGLDSHMSSSITWISHLVFKFYLLLVHPNFLNVTLCNVTPLISQNPREQMCSV